MWESWGGVGVRDHIPSLSAPPGPSYQTIMSHYFRESIPPLYMSLCPTHPPVAWTLKVGGGLKISRGCS